MKPYKKTETKIVSFEIDDIEYHASIDETVAYYPPNPRADNPVEYFGYLVLVDVDVTDVWRFGEEGARIEVEITTELTEAAEDALGEL